jgi:hypothetical protein
MDRRCAEAASGIARRHLRPALEINILKLCLSVGARRSNLDLARERETARLLEGDKTWYEERLPLVEDRVRDRLDQLSVRLGDADWLEVRSARAT